MAPRCINLLNLWMTGPLHDPPNLPPAKSPPHRLDYEAEWTSEPVSMLTFKVNLLLCRQSKNLVQANFFLPNVERRCEEKREMI
jgi:hypothetical protein